MTGVKKIFSKIFFANILSFSSQFLKEHNLLKIEEKKTSFVLIFVAVLNNWIGKKNTGFDLEGLFFNWSNKKNKCDLNIGFE